MCRPVVVTGSSFDTAAEVPTVGEPEGNVPLPSYRGDALRACAFPLGGIGTGHFCICGDGGLRQWQIFNQADHLAYLPNTFFAIRTRQAWEVPKAMLLQSSALYADKGFRQAPLVSDHLIPPEARRLMEILPGVRAIELVGGYPIALLNYQDEDLPLEVSLCAFSPLIPLDQKNSGLPVAFLIFKLHNPSHASVEASLMACLQNAVGWDGITPIHANSNPLYGGNRNALIHYSGVKALLMDNPTLEDSSARKGEMALAVFSEQASARPQWEDLEDLWADFESDGKLEGGAAGCSVPGRTHNGALSVSLDLGAGESREVVFLIAWYFPNRYVNWDQTGLGVTDARTKFWLGNMYGNWFQGVLDVVHYAHRNYKTLREGTELFRDTLFSSTLPEPVLDAISSQISTIRSPTCFWTANGRFFGFEGCKGASTGSVREVGGCCPLNCTHVWNYEQTLSKLFPDLERTMREVDLDWQMGEDGRTPHRTVLPLYLPRWRAEDPTSSVYAADGQCGTILKAYREYRASGERAFLDQHWDALKKCLDFAIRTWDSDFDGVFDGPQWNTYDCHLQGHNTFVSSLYLAALRAMEEMCKVKGEAELEQKCRAIFRKGYLTIQSELWNGEYYVQKYDVEKHKSMQYGSGCHCDQLLGQWWAHLLDLGYVLPRDRVRKALKSIYKYNFKENMKGHSQKPRAYLMEDEGGLLICTWPKGGRPEHPTLYSDEVWTGIEYAVAGLMFYEGMLEEGLRVVRTARARHDGRLRNPWNEVECGDHYVRPLSSWAMLEALSGYAYDAPRKTLRFQPRLGGEKFRCFFITRNGWGAYSQTLQASRQLCNIELKYGSLDLKELRVPKALLAPRSIVVLLGGKELKGVTTSCSKGEIIVKGELRLSRDHALQVAAEAR